jgi:hypothetical protein
MKNLFLLFTLSILMPFSLVFSQTLDDYIFEVKGDTIVVKDYYDMNNEPNSLYQILTLDTDNVPEGRVYELKANGYYPLVNNPTTLRNTVIVGEDNTILVNNDDAESNPPLICGAEWEGSPNYGGINLSHNLTVKNCNIVPATEIGGLGWTFFIPNVDGIKLTLENCLFEHTRWTYMATINSANCSWHIKDCYFVNLSGQPCRRNGGVFDVIFEQQDTLQVENCTHVMGQGMMYKLRANHFNRVIFNHNTFVNVSNLVIMDLGSQSAMSVTNNIFINCNVQPYSPANIDDGEQDIDTLPIGIINVYPDSTIIIDRKMYADKNVVYWDPRLADIASIANSNLVNGSNEWVSQMITMNSRTQAMFDDDATYPYLYEGVWYKELPDFTDPQDLLTDQVDILKAFSYETLDTLSVAILPDWRIVSTGEENYLYSDWPIPIDLSYRNASLLTCAMSNFPIGDINWFPTEKELWLSQRTAEYDQISNFLNGNIEVKSNFGADINKGSIPLTVEFTDSSTGVVASWQWDFNDDGIIDSYEKDPVHTYLDADTYSVKLIASNGLIADTLIKENYIIAYFDSIPNLYSVEDISDDQGGWVEIDFARSFYDTDISNTNESYSIELNDGNGWTSVMDTLASAKNVYSILVPTPLDSNAYSDGLLNFRVIAHMDEGTFTSDSVQGYSIDNIYPATPQNLTTRLTNELYAELSWSLVADIDFSHYLLYRSILGSPLELFKTLTDTFCTDSTVVLDNVYAYALQSVDSSGNTSELSNSVEMLIDNPPQISTLPLISFNEDDSLTYPVSDWYPYITDPDHPDSILIIDIISNNNIFSRFESDHFIFKAKENWYGSDSLEFILSDGTLSDSSMLFFNVRSINDPPQIIGLPDSIVFVIDSSFTLTMNDYGFDIDSPDSLLKWNFEIENDSIMINYDSLSTHLMISSYHFIGQTYLWCMVTDDSGLTGIDSIMLRIDPVTALEDQLRIDIPKEYVLFQNYPNPFNPTTTIRYGLKEPGEVKIIIYDNLGRKITELVNNRQNAGYHQVVWDGKNYLNQQISSGIYYYKLIAENYTAMKKMIFIK